MDAILKQLNKGYTWDKNRNKWMVRIYVNKKSYFLGRYNCEWQAQIVSLLAKINKHIIFSQEVC